MLNRTNQMLSANANAPNLGTRSAAQGLGVNMGMGLLRLRHAHLETQEVETVRAEIAGPFGWPISLIGYPPRPTISGSPFAPSALDPSVEVAAKVVDAEAPPVVRPVVVSDDLRVRTGAAQAAAQPGPASGVERRPRSLKKDAASARRRRLAARAARVGAAETPRSTYVAGLVAITCMAAGR